MATLNMGNQKDRRSGINDRRRYRYNDHIPERRAFNHRRNQQNPQPSDAESKGTSDDSGTESSK